ncbi:MAG: phosphatidylglycerol lysyltransferase domain-containing protein [Woeseia sp.]
MGQLADLALRTRAPLWRTRGHLVFSHGENYYKFEESGSYKEKFDPERQPCYLASEGGWLKLPAAALLDSARLISDGTAQMLATKNQAAETFD